MLFPRRLATGFACTAKGANISVSPNRTAVPAMKNHVPPLYRQQTPRSVSRLTVKAVRVQSALFSFIRSGTTTSEAGTHIAVSTMNDQLSPEPATMSMSIHISTGMLKSAPIMQPAIAPLRLKNLA